MPSARARYDPIADWYAEFTERWNIEQLTLLPRELGDQRVLDMACGCGKASRWLSRHGAHVTGVDISAEMIRRAKQSESDQPHGIDYRVGDTTTTEWWDGECFDGALCHMALMDIDDLDRAFATVVEVLAPGGWFSFSIFHPCYPGGPEGSWSGLPSWPPAQGYHHEGWWCTAGDGVRGRVGAHHRKLSTYLNAALNSGLVFEEFAELGTSVPTTLIALCRHR